MKIRSNLTWLGYLNTLSHKNFSPDPQEDVLIGKALSAFCAQHHELFSCQAPTFYLNDYRTSKYSFMSKSIGSLCGYNAESFLSGGVPYAVNLFHPEDLELLNKQVFLKRLQFLRSIPPEEHPDYIFTYNFRIKTLRGAYISLLQKNIFIKSDFLGNPILSLGMLVDITNYADPNKVIHLIDHNKSLHGIKTLDRTTFFFREEDTLFSKREKEVLLWMADGLTSKEIANKLFISEHTVINHRRNMHEKSNTPNAISLIAFSIKRNII